MFNKPTSNTPKPALPSIEPTRMALRRNEALLKTTGPLVRFALKKYITQIEIQGQEHLANGSNLVLMNHSNAFDPLLLTFYGRRLIHFLVTEPYMSDRPIAKLAASFGQITKRKLDNEARSIRVMKKWSDLGGSAGMFPEGQFPWDGMPLPLQPGLDQLIRYLDMPVVTVRLINGDRLWPAWAKHPRRTGIRIEVDPPKKFVLGEDIEKWISERLRVDPGTCVRFPSQGKNLSEGLAQFLRFCFSCGDDQSLEDKGDELKCTSCKTTWRVTAENELASPSETLSIRDVWNKIKQDLTQKWEPAVVLQSLGNVTVFDASKAEWVPLDSGSLSIQSETLQIGRWNFKLKDLLAHTLDWGDLILLRSHRKRFAIQMRSDSRAVFTLALDTALAKTRGQSE
ncbi:MAG: 1-acyl-sn-glycerol-3-phosphate acyltransferase [Xanthomonadaceae bacterium]|nr:1-acyl-sn-glycerol-3-phosphate acyltransferase [Xanthomonadaceae bacterium]